MQTSCALLVGCVQVQCWMFMLRGTSSCGTCPDSIFKYISRKNSRSPSFYQHCCPITWPKFTILIKTSTETTLASSKSQSSYFCVAFEHFYECFMALEGTWSSSGDTSTYIPSTFGTESSPQGSLFNVLWHIAAQLLLMPSNYMVPSIAF